MSSTHFLRWHFVFTWALQKVKARKEKFSFLLNLLVATTNSSWSQLTGIATQSAQQQVSLHRVNLQDGWRYRESSRFAVVCNGHFTGIQCPASKFHTGKSYWINPAIVGPIHGPQEIMATKSVDVPNYRQEILQEQRQGTKQIGETD